MTELTLLLVAACFAVIAQLVWLIWQTEKTQQAQKKLSQDMRRINDKLTAMDRRVEDAQYDADYAQAQVERLELDMTRVLP